MSINADMNKFKYKEQDPMISHIAESMDGIMESVINAECHRICQILDEYIKAGQYT